MSQTTQGILVVVGALLGSGGVSGYLATRPARSTREGALIDQYQERYEEQEKRAEKLEARLDLQDKRIRDLELRDITLRNYIYTLIKHIEDGAGPPPPPVPKALYG